MGSLPTFLSPLFLQIMFSFPKAMESSKKATMKNSKSLPVLDGSMRSRVATMVGFFFMITLTLGVNPDTLKRLNKFKQDKKTSSLRRRLPWCYAKDPNALAGSRKVLAPTRQNIKNYNYDDKTNYTLYCDGDGIDGRCLSPKVEGVLEYTNFPKVPTVIPWDDDEPLYYSLPRGHSDRRNYETINGVSVKNVRWVTYNFNKNESPDKGECEPLLRRRSTQNARKTKFHCKKCYDKIMVRLSKERPKLDIIKCSGYYVDSTKKWKSCLDTTWEGRNIIFPFQFDTTEENAQRIDYRFVTNGLEEVFWHCKPTKETLQDLIVDHAIPKRKTMRVGKRLTVNVKDARLASQRHQYKCKIEVVHEDGTFDVNYLDGDGDSLSEEVRQRTHLELNAFRVIKNELKFLCQDCMKKTRSAKGCNYGPWGGYF